MILFMDYSHLCLATVCRPVSPRSMSMNHPVSILLGLAFPLHIADNDPSSIRATVVSHHVHHFCLSVTGSQIPGHSASTLKAIYLFGPFLYPVIHTVTDSREFMTLVGPPIFFLCVLDPSFRTSSLPCSYGPPRKPLQ